MKKVLATILALVMAIGLCSVSWATDPASVNSAETLQTAIANGGEVKLDANISATITIPADKTVTLDLNGKTLTGSIVNKGKLTVTGTGSVVATDTETAAVANFPGGTVTLSGGTYMSERWYVIKNMGEMYINGSVSVQKPDGSTDTSSLIDNGWVNGSDTVAGVPVPAQADKAKLFISSGTFTGKSGAKSCSVVKNDDYGVLEISGGTFDSTANNGTDNATTLLNWNIARISGGTFNGMYPISNGAYNNDADKGQITITGGEFIGTSTIFGNGQGGDGKGAVTVSGGTFTAPALGAGYENARGGYTLAVTGGTFSRDLSDVSDYAPEGTPVAIVGNDYAVGSAVIAAAANNGKSVMVTKAGPINGVDAGKSITVNRGVTGVTVNGVPVTGGSYTVPSHYYYYPTTDTKTDTTKGSPKTFDAGIALYVGMALTSAAGVAFVGKKRED